jgi:hypothetical protein
MGRPAIVRHPLVFASVLLGGIVLGGPVLAATQLSAPLAQLYSSAELEPPNADQMPVCYGFGCRLRFYLAFSSAEKANIVNLMSKGRGSAVDERKAIQQVFVWFDLRVGHEVGTDKRVANADIRTFDADHNFDCWDTMRNGTSLLLVLQEWGLLKFHTVSDPRSRGNPLFFQLPHNTPVLKENAANGTKWVVDMWPTPFGHVPDVMTLDKWLDEY